MAPRVLVLGGCGFVGRHIVPRLVDAGEFVLVPTRRLSVAAAELRVLPTCEVVQANVHEPGVLDRLVAQSDVVINLIGILNADHAQAFSRVHVELVSKLIAACDRAGVRRLIHMSALNAAPDGPSHYLRSKGEGEALVAGSGLDWTIFRPSVIFGRGDSFLSRFATLLRFLPAVALGSTEARFQPVHVGDVAHCFATATREKRTAGERYELCGPRAYTLGELVRLVGEISGRERPIVPLSPALARMQAAVLERLPGKLLTRDNLDSMSCANVCNAAFPPLFGIEPVAIEAVAPEYLAPTATQSRFDRYRLSGGR